MTRFTVAAEPALGGRLDRLADAAELLNGSSGQQELIKLFSNMPRIGTWAAHPLMIETTQHHA